MNISIEHVTKKIKDATVLKDICLEMKKDRDTKKYRGPYISSGHHK